MNHHLHAVLADERVAELHAGATGRLDRQRQKPDAGHIDHRRSSRSGGHALAMTLPGVTERPRVLTTAFKAPIIERSRDRARAAMTPSGGDRNTFGWLISSALVLVGILVAVVLLVRCPVGAGRRW